MGVFSFERKMYQIRMQRREEPLFRFRRSNKYTGRGSIKTGDPGCASPIAGDLPVERVSVVVLGLVRVLILWASGKDGLASG